MSHQEIEGLNEWKGEWTSSSYPLSYVCISHSIEVISVCGHSKLKLHWQYSWFPWHSMNPFRDILAKDILEWPILADINGPGSDLALRVDATVGGGPHHYSCLPINEMGLRQRIFSWVSDTKLDRSFRVCLRHMQKISPLAPGPFYANGWTWVTGVRAWCCESVNPLICLSLRLPTCQREDGQLCDPGEDPGVMLPENMPEGIDLAKMLPCKLIIPWVVDPGLKCAVCSENVIYWLHIGSLRKAIVGWELGKK